MTHDELLAKINKYCEDITSGQVWTTDVFIKSLYAVVELHKPSPIPDWVPTEDKLMCWCAHVYPCPTVKAIEKELYEPIA
jgi:hypothetical protein